MKGTSVILIALLAVMFAFTACIYASMPEKIATHWNIQGEANGYMPRFEGLFLLPVLTIGLILLLAVIPKIDPLKRNIDKFNDYYWWLIVLLAFFMFLIQIEIVLWNLGIKLAIGLVLSIGLGALFFYIGVLFNHTKRNWFIGIRTPWTLSSDKVWDTTHRLGSRLFKISGILALIGVILPKYAFFFIIIPIILSALILVVYSYLEFRKIKKR